MTAVPDLRSARWFKSSLSSDGNNCVEVARLADDRVAVRDSKDPAGAALIFTRDEWRAFIGGVRLGELDL